MKLLNTYVYNHLLIHPNTVSIKIIFYEFMTFYSYLNYYNIISGIFHLYKKQDKRVETKVNDLNCITSFHSICLRNLQYNKMKL